MAQYKVAQEKRQDTTARYEMLLGLIEETMSAVVDVESLNEAMVKLFAMEQIYDSFLRVQRAVANKGKELGFTYNKIAKRYE